MSLRQDRGAIFGAQLADAAAYDRYRPAYPAELFDELVSVSGIQPHATVLEIGCGTGIATLPLAQRQLAVAALDPSPHMLDVAQREISPSTYPNVSFVQTTFQSYAERVKEKPSKVRVIAAFTAFHWLETNVRLTQCEELLEPNGVLAIGSSNHITGGPGNPLYEATHEVIETYIPKPVDDHDPETVSVIYDGHTPADIVPPLKDPELENSPFNLARFSVFNMAVPHTANEYAGLIGTFSAVKALAEGKRADLLSELTRIVRDDLDDLAIVKFVPSLGIYRLK